ncbi:tektin-B1-like [Convolutriloba macropyga]|uniref:tektin-B1-like n=1 Tax=Convolutriloba macropyga TaxID=536237 RepID=UPI003F51B743
MATQSKPSDHFTLGDWNTSNFTISTNAERGRNASFAVRQDGRHLINDTEIITRWNQQDNKTRLENRCDDIQKWRDRLEETRDQLDEEIARLKADKEVCERALEAKALPLDVANQNLTTREGRLKIDLVDDVPSAELKKEVEVIEGTKVALQQKCSQAFEQLCRLEEARKQILRDLEHKIVALDIDNEQANLTQDSSEICFQPNPTRVTKGHITPQEWDAHSRYNRARAESEMQASIALRGAINQTIRQTANDVEAQKNATEYSMKNRIADMEKAKVEDEWQKDRTEKEIAEMKKDIAKMEQSIRDKEAPLKLAETRLENRTCRPSGLELCRDNAQYGLVNEVNEIKNTIKALKDKLKQEQHELTNCEHNLQRVNEDLALKNNSLALDKDVMDYRKQLEGVNHNFTKTGTSGQYQTIKTAQAA